jgi:hypothetical protein
MIVALADGITGKLSWARIRYALPAGLRKESARLIFGFAFYAAVFQHLRQRIENMNAQAHSGDRQHDAVFQREMLTDMFGEKSEPALLIFRDVFPVEPAL